MVPRAYPTQRQGRKERHALAAAALATRSIIDSVGVCLIALTDCCQVQGLPRRVTLCHSLDEFLSGSWHCRATATLSPSHINKW